MQIRPERPLTASRAQLLWVGGLKLGEALLPAEKHTTFRTQHVCVWSDKPAFDQPVVFHVLHTVNPFEFVLFSSLGLVF